MLPKAPDGASMMNVPRRRAIVAVAIVRIAADSPKLGAGSNLTDIRRVDKQGQTSSFGYPWARTNWPRGTTIAPDEPDHTLKDSNADLLLTKMTDFERPDKASKMVQTDAVIGGGAARKSVRYV
jgi:hypothetical protein